MSMRKERNGLAINGIFPSNLTLSEDQLTIETRVPILERFTKLGWITSNTIFKTVTRVAVNGGIFPWKNAR
jgi:hypothetical protein